MLPKVVLVHCLMFFMRIGVCNKMYILFYCTLFFSVLINHLLVVCDSVLQSVGRMLYNFPILFVHIFSFILGVKYLSFDAFIE